MGLDPDLEDSARDLRQVLNRISKLPWIHMVKEVERTTAPGIVEVEILVVARFMGHGDGSIGLYTIPGTGITGGSLGSSHHVVVIKLQLVNDPYTREFTGVREVDDECGDVVHPARNRCLGQSDTDRIGPSLQRLMLTSE